MATMRGLALAGFADHLIAITFFKEQPTTAAVKKWPEGFSLHKTSGSHQTG
jgi:hypothetical protein